MKYAVDYSMLKVDGAGWAVQALSKGGGFEEISIR